MLLLGNLNPYLNGLNPLVLASTATGNIVVFALSWFNRPDPNPHRPEY